MSELHFPFWPSTIKANAVGVSQHARSVAPTNLSCCGVHGLASLPQHLLSQTDHSSAGQRHKLGAGHTCVVRSSKSPPQASTTLPISTTACLGAGPGALFITEGVNLSLGSVELAAWELSGGAGSNQESQVPLGLSWSGSCAPSLCGQAPPGH